MHADWMNGDGMRMRHVDSGRLAAAALTGIGRSGVTVVGAGGPARPRSSEQRTRGDLEFHHGGDHLDPDGDPGVELLVAHLRREGLLRLHQRPGWRQRPQDRLQVRARRRREPDHVQPAGQHPDQPGPRLRRDRRGHRLLLAQHLRRVGDPDLRLQRHRQLGRPDRTCSPPAGRWSTTRPEAPEVAYVARQDAHQAVHRRSSPTASRPRRPPARRRRPALQAAGYNVSYTDSRSPTRARPWPPTSSA